MMMESSTFYQVINELRMARSMSVSALCDGIISERAYYRLLNSNQDMKFEVFNKLSDRLGANASDIFQFIGYVRKGDPQSGRFIYRVHTRHYDDIGDIYDAVLNKREDHEHFQYLLDVFIAKYQYQTNRITRKAYVDVLRSVFEVIPHEVRGDVFILGILTECGIHGVGEDETLNRLLIEAFLTFDYRLGFLVFIVSFDTFMAHALTSSVVDADAYLRMQKRFEEIHLVTAYKFFHMRNYLYRAFARHLEGKTATDDLYRYAMNVLMLVNDEEAKKAFALLKSVFDVDAINLMDAHTRTMITRHFEIGSDESAPDSDR
jgi:hypothetical protein